jgi:hypothetical protein
MGSATLARMPQQTASHRGFSTVPALAAPLVLALASLAGCEKPRR